MLTHKTFTCCHEGCYATITLHPDDERRLRKSHEDFYCPAGHVQGFYGKTDQEKQIDRLQKTVERIADHRRELMGRLSDLARAAQTCPLGCGWQGNRRLRTRGGYDGVFYDRIGGDLANHLAQVHGLEVKVVNGRIVAPDFEGEPA